ncbi:HAD family hydrolase [Cohnella sp. WQ 127256]|uniref:HAD family hydrolase n=1 Tax=Cohnella sp. WQ 127256 TaxID=2938790 RepID=UPI00211931D3|nr:HAD family hydrolase [Cohnella sp. WQ 127256]
MGFKAFVLDLDGTLVDSNKQVSDRSCKAITNAYHQGIKIIIATARPPRAVSWLLPEVLQDICSYVYYNGAMIRCNDSNFSFHTTIDAELSAQILEFCLLQDSNVEISIEVEDRWFCLKEFDYSILKSVGGKPEVKDLEELKTFNPTKIIVSGLKDIETLKNRFESRAKILVTDQGNLVQISNLEATKELAVLKLSSIYGISIDDVIVFGDDTNDIGLFKICGQSVAMENAIEELKEIASEITTSNDNEGVAVVIERLCG